VSVLPAAEAAYDANSGRTCLIEIQLEEHLGRREANIMFLITVTNWRRKAGVIVRLLLFLLLLWMITPQFFSFISKAMASFQKPPQSQSLDQMVVQPTAKKPGRHRDDQFLNWLQEYYLGSSK
jgi:hypothetical protein